MNKLEAYQAQLAAQAEQRAQERAERAAFMAQVQANRERIAAGGEIAAPPSLNDIFTANRAQLKAEEAERRRQIKNDVHALSLHTLPQPPHVIEQWKKDYFAQLAEE